MDEYHRISAYSPCMFKCLHALDYNVWNINEFQRCHIAIAIKCNKWHMVWFHAIAVRVLFYNVLYDFLRSVINFSISYINLHVSAVISAQGKGRLKRRLETPTAFEHAAAWACWIARHAANAVKPNDTCWHFWLPQRMAKDCNKCLSLCHLGFLLPPILVTGTVLHSNLASSERKMRRWWDGWSA